MSSTEAVDQSTQERKSQHSGRGWLWPTAVATVLVVAVVAFLLAQSDGGDADALATVDRYFETFNSGDVEATLDFLADDGGDFNLATDPADTPFAQSGYEDTSRAIAWAVAAETTLTNDQCSAADDGQGAVLVECSFEIEDIHRRTMGLPALAASLTVSVEDDRFADFDEAIVLSEGSAFADYVEWLAGTHPEEVEVAAQLEWGSVEEAVAAGEARARYVEEWSESLETQSG